MVSSQYLTYLISSLLLTKEGTTAPPFGSVEDLLFWTVLTIYLSWLSTVFIGLFETAYADGGILAGDKKS